MYICMYVCMYLVFSAIIRLSGNFRIIPLPLLRIAVVIVVVFILCVCKHCCHHVAMSQCRMQLWLIAHFAKTICHSVINRISQTINKRSRCWVPWRTEEITIRNKCSCARQEKVKNYNTPQKCTYTYLYTIRAYVCCMRLHAMCMWISMNGYIALHFVLKFY